MGKKNYNPEEHGYMPLPPVDEDGEMLIPMAANEQINLRDKHAGANSHDGASAQAEVVTEAPAEMPEVAEEAQVETEPEEPSVELAATGIESGASENFGAKVAAVGLAAKARAAAMTDKIRQNPAAAIASFAGAAVVIALTVMTFVWTRSAGEDLKPDQIADNTEHQDENENKDPEFPEGENSVEVETPIKIADLVCVADKTKDTLYGFKGFANMAVERRVTFTSANVPNELFVTNIFTFDDKKDVEPKTAEYKKLFDAKYPKATRGFSIAWNGAKNTGIQMTLSTKLMNNLLDDAQLLQFGLSPDKNADGTLTAHYTREEILKRWTAEGFRCSGNTVASK
jgi:hypothetical protein